MSIKKTKKSAARTFLEEVTGGPLTLADLLHAIRVGEGDTAKSTAKNVRNLIVPGKAVVQERIVGVQQVKHAAVAQQQDNKEKNQKRAPSAQPDNIDTNNNSLGVTIVLRQTNRKATKITIQITQGETYH